MWEIRGKQEKIKAEVSSLEYNGEWMGESYVSATVESPEPVDFRIGDYLIYRGERFEINYDPSVIKSANPNEKGDAFKYENVKFNSLADELTRCDFLDVVLNDNNIHHTSLPVFSFFAETVKDLADRIQANLDRLYPGKWTVECNPEYAEKTRINVSVSNIKVWGALQIAVNDFGCTFSIKGRHITIGMAGLAVSHMFRYGKNNGLYEIGRTAESDQAIVTRLRAYGSTRNLPHRYYATIGAKIGVLVTGKEKFVAPSTQHIYLESYGKLADRATITLSINGKEYKATHFDKLGTMAHIFKVDGISEAEAKKIIPNQTIVNIVSGAVPSDFDPKYIDTSGVVLPDNMAVTNLMLPGFPSQSLRDAEGDNELKIYCSDSQYDPYVDSPNAEEIGIREGTVFFDGSGELEEIYPSLQGMTKELLVAAGGESQSTGELDVLYSADPIEDNGMSVIKGEEQKPQSNSFEIVIKDPGFNLWDYRTSQAPAIAFNSGKLAGREFEITSCKRDGKGYRLKCTRIYDDAIQLWFPYRDYNAAEGDKFVLLYIDMPDIYIKVASQRLLEAAREYLSKHDYSRSIYPPKIDEVMMARQHQAAMESGGKLESLHDTIREGMKLLFEDEDLGIDGSVYIDRLTIREGDGPVPTYEVTLKEEKTVGTLERLQNKIDSVLTGTMGANGKGGLGYTAQEIRQFVYAYGRDRFLSKLEPDEARALIKLIGGVEVGEYARGIKGAAIDPMGNAEVESITVRQDARVGSKLTIGEYIPGVSGGVFYIDENGEAHLETAELTVNKKLKAKEVEIQEQTWVGGSQINSPAGMTCDRVEKIDGGWRCYFRAEDASGRKIYNEFREGDLARCETFNLMRDADGMTVNRYYWRRVNQAGYETDADGLDWGYIDLSDKDGEFDSDSVCAPAEGDRIITVGNDHDPERQNLIISASYGEGSPYLYQFKGIDTFSLSRDKLKTAISPDGNIFTGQFIIEAKGKTPQPLDDYLNSRAPYTLRPSVTDVLKYPDGSFAPVAFGCTIFQANGTGNIRQIPYPQGSPGIVTLGDLFLMVDTSAVFAGVSVAEGELRIEYVVRRYNEETDTTTDDPAKPYTGVIFPEADMRSVTFHLHLDELEIDRCCVSVQTDASVLESEFHTTFEVTEKKIEAIARQTNAVETRTSSLEVTAQGILGKVARVSHNLAGKGKWDNPSQIFEVDNIEGGFSALQGADLDSVWQTFRALIDSKQLLADTDYTLSMQLKLMPDTGGNPIPDSELILRAGVADGSQTYFAMPWQHSPLSEYEPGKWYTLTFHFRSSEVLYPQPMFLQLIIHDWNSRTQPISIETRHIKLEQGTVATPWVPDTRDLESTISQQADEIAMSVKVDGQERAGMTVDAEEGITLQADKVRIKNGDMLAALFTGGILNANLIEVTKLATKANGLTRITIGEFEDPYIRFYHEDGVTLAMKVGLEYVSLSSDATVSPKAQGDVAVQADATLEPTFQTGKLAVIQVFDVDGNLTWVLFTDGPITPDSQPYSWRTYSLVREVLTNKDEINSPQTLKADEYWQFRVKAGTTGKYAVYADHMFVKKLNNAGLDVASSYYVLDGRYYYPQVELEMSVAGGESKAIRRYLDISAGKITKRGYIYV